jgi:hypothetical protein
MRDVSLCIERDFKKIGNLPFLSLDSLFIVGYIPWRINPYGPLAPFSSFRDNPFFASRVLRKEYSLPAFYLFSFLSPMEGRFKSLKSFQNFWTRLSASNKKGPGFY